MRPRNAPRTRWLLVVALAAPGCLFRPIFHPPSNTGSDASVSDSSRANTDAAASDVSAPFDAGTSMDAPQPPPDDCRDYFDSATGMYYPDAHHADGALCELPTTADAGADVPVADVSEVDAIDATSDDATADTAGDDASTGDATSDDASSDDASADDASADDASADDASADDAAADDATSTDDTVTDDATDPDV